MVIAGGFKKMTFEKFQIHSLSINLKTKSMKKALLAFTGILSIAIAFTSCSVEKRHYLDGYHVEWNKNSKQHPVTINEKPASIKAIAATPGETSLSTAATSETSKTEAPSTPVVAENNAVAPLITSAAKATQLIQKQEEVKQLTASAPVLKKTVKAAKKPAGDGTNKGLLFVLCILMPWLAVGLATNWNAKKVIANLLWSLTCIGGIIHAFVVVSKS